MKSTFRMVGQFESGNQLAPVDLMQVAVTSDCVMGIDGSTNNTGIAIVGMGGDVKYVGSFKKDKDETPVEYKVAMKSQIRDMILRNPGIKYVLYEEPFIQHVNAAKQLFMLRSFFEEIIAEMKPSLDYIKRYDVNNKKWKKHLIGDERLQNDRELEKEQVRRAIETKLPFMVGSVQDEMDALGIAAFGVDSIRSGTEKSIASKKKLSSFQYEAVFCRADSDVQFMDVIMEHYTGPEKLLYEKGVSIVELKKNANFDKAVYEELEDDDYVLVLKFGSNTHGSVLMKYRLGHLIGGLSDYVYAIIWRKRRLK